MELSSQKTSPRDAFLYLLAIGTLFISVWRLIDLLFTYINKLFPDQLQNYYDGSFTDIRLSISTLFVVFPVYLATTWYLRKDSITHPEKRELRVRKWLLNFTLFVAALTIIVDLVELVNTFLNGELTIRFFLKVIVVLVIAGSVLAYYLWDLRRTTSPESRPSKVLAFVSSAFVLASIVAGFFIIGSPMAQRQIKFDERRINDLQNLQSQIINYRMSNPAMPRTIAEANMGNFTVPKDPETQKDYEYKITGPLAFELCAIFNLASQQDKESRQPYYAAPYPYGTVEGPQIWDHTAGRACFKMTVTLPPPFPPKPI